MLVQLTNNDERSPNHNETYSFHPSHINHPYFLFLYTSRDVRVCVSSEIVKEISFYFWEVFIW